jgi:putative DNA primase/helicase
MTAAHNHPVDVGVRPIVPDLQRGTRLTDVGNAERLVLRHGADLRYCHPLREWYVFDGRRFARDDNGEVERRAKDTVRALYVEASNAPDDERERLARWAMASESDARLRAMMAQAQSEPGVAVSPRALDADPMLLNVLNGTIDLRTGQLREHRREDLLTKLVPIAFDPANTACDQWLAFLVSVFAGDNDRIDFLQRAFGYSLTGNTDEHALFVPYGTGRNGKSTKLEILRDLLGEYARSADSSTFLARRNADGGGPREDIARLKGARVVTAIEAGEGRRLDEERIKAVTGGDVVPARMTYAKHSIEFQPEFKLWLAANHKPVIRGTDEGIWSRIMLIPFTVYFPPEKRDKDLKAKLRAELPAILVWAVQGCLDWQAKGLVPPASVRKATQGYREEMDVVTDTSDVNAETPGGALHRAYSHWCRNANDKPLSSRSFGDRLTEHGITNERRGGVVYRKHVRLLLSFAGQWSQSGQLEAVLPELSHERT